ncbi:family 43 glycosylhydrolase [Jiangella alkaliphila]|uniref:Glycosyl hydrolases family 43 n=1 Tax=Jiangella alkaliphila TaxID=419479 RepID=A0A1H2LRB2_9ACTN|nr:Glycosyl hydrolases family 43 [Jiangella alkaliphila]
MIPVRRRFLAGIAAVVLALPAAAPVATAEPAADPVTQNPISGSFSDTYADPAVIRGKDGYWYLYATSDPLHEAPSEFGLMHIARSRDFTDWEYLGTVFEEGDRPAWTTNTSFYWAPDIRYVDGQYVMYYTVTDTVAEAGPWNYAIGAATAPTPAGPWTDTGGPVVAPRPTGNGDYFNTIDPALLSASDGKRYLYFGGFHGGLWVTELDETGLRAVGSPTQVTIADRYEGSFVVERDGWYYLTASSANCCAGPVTGYSVYAGRSTSPLGPFVDHEGVSMLDSRVGGTQVLAQNGNRWIGVGHHTIVTDVSGQDHIVYHAIDRDDAWLDAPGGVNERPTLVDRLDWIDGWPVARAGAGPSDTPQPAPVTASSLGIDASAPASNGALRGDWSAGTDSNGDGGAVAVLSGEARTTRNAPRDVRVEADVRAAGTFSVEVARSGRNAITVTVDPAARTLTATATRGGRVERDTAPLPSRWSGEEWTALAVEVRDGRVVARLAESRLGDADAEVAVDLPRGLTGSRPVTLSGTAQVDNLTVVEAHEPVTERVDEPRTGRTVFTENFGGDLRPGWEWLRPSSSVTVGDGVLNWPLASVDVVGAGNTGPLLLRTPPEGEWIAETKLNLDLGSGTIRNYQQAGLIVRVDDDNLLRLGDVAIWGSRQVEFGKELNENGALRWGAHLGGPVASTMWLRIHHTTDPETGEHQYRSASSRDGETWRWGATWTLPADTSPSIGLYAGGGATPATVATFDWFRLYEVR